MKLRTIPAYICVALVALVATSAAGATSKTPDGSQMSALRGVGISWVTYAVRGNAPKACRLQVEPSVGDVPCDQLPTYFTVLHCPEFNVPDEDYPWLKGAELIGKIKINGSKGTIVYRAARKKSMLTAKATFSTVGGKWRIASIQSSGQRLSPAGLIFTDGQELRKQLWPAHC
jgi:hypothetical protein